MWFFLGAIVAVALIALWLRRTNLYRALRSGKPPQGGGHFGGPGEVS